MIQIQLSIKQREALQPLFDEAEAYYIVGEPGAVMLQAWPDKKTGYAQAYFVYYDQVKAINKVMGIDDPPPADDIPF